MENTDKMRKNDGKFIFLGDDKRQERAAQILSSLGIASTLARTIDDAEFDASDNEKKFLVFPIPLSSATFQRICGRGLAEICAAAEWRKISIVGVNISADVALAAQTHGIETVDFGKNESFLLENAYLTAEGAVNIIMQASAHSIRSQRIALLGYGRISKFLLSILRALGASVSVFARRDEMRTLALCDGATHAGTLGTEDAISAIEENDVLINTVPFMILDEKTLGAAKKRPMLIDLASLPGGIDVDKACALGYKATRELSLPARYAPDEAGEIVARTLLSVLF